MAVGSLGDPNYNYTPFILQLCPVDVTDTGFSQTLTSLQQGETAIFAFPQQNSGSEEISDATGLNLYDSGLKPPGSIFSYRFVAAGTYAVAEASTGAQAEVVVPMKAKPRSGGTGGFYRLTWSAAKPPHGDVFDVQVARPGGDWQDWMVGVTSRLAAFTPDAGAGRYQFHARLREAVSGIAAGWSPTVSIRVASLSPGQVLHRTTNVR